MGEKCINTLWGIVFLGKLYWTAYNFMHMEVEWDRGSLLSLKNILFAMYVCGCFGFF